LRARSRPLPPGDPGDLPAGPRRPGSGRGDVRGLPRRSDGGPDRRRRRQRCRPLDRLSGPGAVGSRRRSAAVLRRRARRLATLGRRRSRHGGRRLPLHGGGSAGGRRTGAARVPGRPRARGDPVL
ncbi:MAG: hypothetical protein AVDCRST_MAG79-981, partial [uncultured Thermoleophilia bacterium]